MHRREQDNKHKVGIRASKTSEQTITCSIAPRVSHFSAILHFLGEQECLRVTIHIRSLRADCAKNREYSIHQLSLYIFQVLQYVQASIPALLNYSVVLQFYPCAWSEPSTSKSQDDVHMTRICAREENSASHTICGSPVEYFCRSSGCRCHLLVLFRLSFSFFQVLLL